MSAADYSSYNFAREDVHKSCKSLETVVNLLNGYCEAASAVVLLQKKLVKAIRDAASIKASPFVANSTLSVTAAILEIISEVDGKFVKIADKECDNINDGVKKWFRKLAREERTHDEKIASASSRIKQAGQTYEKKVKKNTSDAAEEHTRYIQLLSSLGHEISQEKTNHSRFVAQNHAAVTCSVSSSLARIADAEWARCCERVRKTSPQIGSLGEWRSFCDGEWTGNFPSDLPDSHTPVAMDQSLAALHAVEEDSKGNTDSESNRASPANITRTYTPPDVVSAPPSPTIDSDLSQHDRAIEKSDVPALDHFPAPPIHFPLPHLRVVVKGSLGGPAGSPPLYGRRMTSPISPAKESTHSTTVTPTELVAATARQTPSHAAKTVAEISTQSPAPSRSNPRRTSLPVDLPTTVPTSDDTEFGTRQPRILPPSGSSGSSTLPKGSPRGSGVVLAMRNRFAQTSISSAPSREATASIPRLPVSVPTIASRYQPGNEHPSVSSYGPQTETMCESPFNDTTNASDIDMNFERMGKEPLPEERDPERRLRKHDLEPQVLTKPTSTRAENPPIRDRARGHNQSVNTRETITLQQNVNIHCVPPVDVVSLQRGLTRSPSLVSSHTQLSTGLPGSPPENPRLAKSRGWIRRLSMPVLSSVDGSKKTNSPLHNDSSQAWRSSLALPEAKARHRKTSLDTFDSKSNQRR